VLALALASHGARGHHERTCAPPAAVHDGHFPTRTTGTGTGTETGYCNASGTLDPDGRGIGGFPFCGLLRCGLGG
jgi:hypothetical protein